MQGSHFLLPQTVNSEKRGKSYSTTGFKCLKHSNWTIYSPSNTFLFWKFSICHTFILGSQILLPQRSNSEKGGESNSKTEWNRGVWVSGAFKLNHLQPFKPILFRKLSICFTFILGGQFLLPQRANSEKREIFQFQNWMRQRGLGAWGIQTGPCAPL